MAGLTLAAAGEQEQPYGRRTPPGEPPQCAERRYLVNPAEHLEQRPPPPHLSMLPLEQQERKSLVEAIAAYARDGDNPFECSRAVAMEPGFVLFRYAESPAVVAAVYDALRAADDGGAAAVVLNALQGRGDSPWFRGPPNFS